MQEVVNYQSAAPQREVQEVGKEFSEKVEDLEFMILQILDEGIVKPEDHQDVATQM